MTTRTLNKPNVRTASGPGKWLRRHLATGMMALAGLMTAFGSIGCQDIGSSAALPTDAGISRPSGNLAPGDEISVSFSGAPELNTKQKIQPNGKVSLPTVGDVTASGRTINSLQSSLTSLYQPHLQDPNVVIALESAAAGIYVSGEVLRPGKIPFDRPMTALEAVMEAGGFTKFANPKQVIVIRKEGSKQQRYVLNMNDALTGLDSSPFYVRPFDVIYVRQSAW